MKKITKAKTIYRAFTQQSNIDENVLKHRRDICKTCEYNSDNSDNLTVVQSLRKKATSSPFCTACSCQIDEKTAQETEECGLASIGIEPRWNRIVLETTDLLDLNFINLNHSEVNIDLERNYYLLDFGNINSDIEYEFLLESKNINYELKSLNPGCTSCTEASFEKVDLNTYKCKLSIKASEFSKGVFLKRVNVVYKIKDILKTVIVKFKGVKNEV